MPIVTQTLLRKPRGRPKSCNCNVCHKCRERLRKADYRKRIYEQMEREYEEEFKNSQRKE